ncbi:YtxH domain-containing protein [Limnothrix sp. FACHB-1083]|uniref:YtxH domain-containing protein n=1 Tax=unclassified Limnothrix TaxID=2632864 RepID=UPI001680980E|nr:MULTISPECIES: YtxH domain-containing protein [unclassified Limnothrix]MBD2160098.1 YtxH domain-containing protein [Limnothrix sp. FACHB-1083]MBD2190800.1 YtxH domain-containing protein [Limnothrix sp. FACHB-1088]
MSKRQSDRFALGILLGAATGAVAGLLLAPRSGRASRQRLQQSLQNTLQKTVKQSGDRLPGALEELGQVVRDQAAIWSDRTRDRLEGALDRLRDAIASGVAASQTVDQEDVSLSEEGDAIPTGSAPTPKPRQLAYNRMAAPMTQTGDR